MTTSSPSSSTLEQDWQSLIRWLTEEHGMENLYVSCEEIPGAGRGIYQTASFPYNKFAPPSNVLSIPTSALINAHTLRTHYPSQFTPLPLTKSKKASSSRSKTSLEKAQTEDGEPDEIYPLTATQLVTLHLALHNPNQPALSSLSTQDPWAPFLKVLPQSFRWHHPLTWLVAEVDQEGDQEAPGMKRWRDLERFLPKEVRRLVQDVEKRFWEDVKVLKTVLKTHPTYSSTDLSTSLSQSSLLWAWLNVNTRCLSFPLLLEPSSGTNDLTLAPILDMANHSSSSTPIPCTLPSSVPASKASTYVLPASEDQPDPRSDGQNDSKREVLLQYGPHEDGFLMAEYGFVCYPPDEEGRGGNEWNEVCVDRWVEEIVSSLGSEGAKRKEILEEERYWGQYTLHLSSTPHPSHNLITALRLLLLPVPSSSSTDIQAWRDTILGYLPFVSDANESSVRSELARICTAVEIEAAEGESTLDGLVASVERAEEAEEGEWKFSVQSVRQLWRERQRIARGVKEAVEEGVEF
ncbi:N-methyltransferase [Phaffia rhodozyma]|uniref:N-methyltransferase n=1 Tax=Phaffia rhodozyma TaxID=264483 RepID=A0A0F7SGA3_PHARH|nr:N-methyltransferase [Phaffia rhodozyma]